MFADATDCCKPKKLKIPNEVSRKTSRKSDKSRYQFFVIASATDDNPVLLTGSSLGVLRPLGDNMYMDNKLFFFSISVR